MQVNKQYNTLSTINNLIKLFSAKSLICYDKPITNTDPTSKESFLTACLHCGTLCSTDEPAETNHMEDQEVECKVRHCNHSFM